MPQVKEERACQIQSSFASSLLCAINQADRGRRTWKAGLDPASPLSSSPPSSANLSTDGDEEEAKDRIPF
jgi:hypothetical protein